MITIHPVHTKFIPAMWGKVWEKIGPGLKYGDGKWDEKSIKEQVLAREIQTWVVARGEKVTAIFLTRLSQYPCKKVCSVFAAGGELPPQDARQAGELLSDWAKKQECDSIEIYGRPGWKRALGWDHIHTVIRKKL